MLRYRSRKFIIAFSQLPVLALLPLVYKYYGISDAVTLVVLASISGAVAAYCGFNVLDKKRGVDGQT